MTILLYLGLQRWKFISVAKLEGAVYVHEFKYLSSIQCKHGSMEDEMKERAVQEMKVDRS